jgi:hypothetical protein
MSLKKIKISASDTPIKLNLLFTGDNVVISYKWNLWESTSNKRHYNEDKVGTNLNADDDSFELPQPNSKNIGRLIVIDFGVVLADPSDSGRNWSITAQVTQGVNTDSVTVPDPPKDIASEHLGGSIYIMLISE